MSEECAACVVQIAAAGVEGVTLGVTYGATALGVVLLVLVVSWLRQRRLVRDLQREIDELRFLRRWEAD